MNEVYDKLLNCLDCVRSQVDFSPQVALVLGSGLGDFVSRVRVVATLDYKDIEGFPVSTVLYHEGRYVFGYVEDVPVVIMQGRIHYYEGYSMSDVVLPIRLMGMMGAEVLMLTNAAGGLAEDMKPGDLMLLTDQIADFVPSPLIGHNIDALGTRFPDMSHIYKEDLQQMIRDTAEKLDLPLKEGIYIQLSGPAFETPAEVRMCKILGADAVGMSTACEALAANHMGMQVCGISLITNLAAGISKEPMSHKDVVDAANRTAPLFQKLVWESIVNITHRNQK